MAQKVIWTVSAYKDLQNIVEYISQDSMYYAISFYDDVMEKRIHFKNSRIRGLRIVPELDDLSMREVFIHRYRLIYKTSDESIIIHTIIHGARDYLNK